VLNTPFVSLRKAVGRVRALPPLAVDIGIALACYGAAVASALDHDKRFWWVFRWPRSPACR
jgi:hypothetical protein